MIAGFRRRAAQEPEMFEGEDEHLVSLPTLQFTRPKAVHGRLTGPQEIAGDVECTLVAGNKESGQHGVWQMLANAGGAVVAEVNRRRPLKERKRTGAAGHRGGTLRSRALPPTISPPRDAT